MRKRPTESRPVLHAPAPPSPSEMERLERELERDRAADESTARGIAVVDFYV